MKNVLVRIAAFMLVIWYFVSVIGFDVHTCSGSGESYVTTVIGGTACEDIHPEHDRKACQCCHHGYDAHYDSESETPELAAKSCCSDDWQMIQLTGCKTFQEQDDSSVFHSGMFPLVVELYADNVQPYINCSGLRAFFKPDSGDVVPRDFQRTYGVWRI